jgi:Holliday junction DNA helicase RuvA
MIARLRGTVEEIAGGTVTLDVNGVGYEVTCSAPCVTQLEVGTAATVVIYTDIKEDSIKLYGFADTLEKQVFLLLTRVKGLGAKSASDIVSRVDKRELLRTIGAGDVARLQEVRGVGKKTAERIVVELKDKVAEFALEREEPSARRGAGGPFDEALAALQALGFSAREAEQALARAKADVVGLVSATESGEVVRHALRFV